MKSLTNTIKNLPSNAGIYEFLDKKGKILYIGKAKNLKNRIRSYFSFGKNSAITPNSDLNYQKQTMISRCERINYTIVTDEHEALLLENTLIKKHQPPFNIDLKDDKTYLYVKISKKTPFPQVETTRNTTDKDAEYFGPYTSANDIRSLLKLIRFVFPFRSCKRNLSKLPNGRVCLLYHLGLCCGPCEKKQSEEEYTISINNIKEILRGHYDNFIESITRAMHAAAQNEDFEKAKIFRDHIRTINNTIRKQSVISSRKENFNVHSVVEKDELVAYNALCVRDGRIIDSKNTVIKNKGVNDMNELLRQNVFNYYRVSSDTPNLIIISHPINVLPKNITSPLVSQNIENIIVPKRGYRKQILDISIKNATEALINHRLSELPRERIASHGIIQLQKLLHIARPLRRIECFDISNTQGTLSYGSMTVFIDGASERKQYRLFKIRSVTKPDDYKSIYEVISRRLMRLSENDKSFPRPDLIVIDGGKGQLGAALAAARDLDITNIPFISLAKQNEEIFIPNHSKAIRLPRNAPALLLLQNIRDEAHRFGIMRHRKTREKKMTVSSLDEIPGIGPKTRVILIDFYGSVQKIREADISEIIRLIGHKKAKLVKKYIK